MWKKIWQRAIVEKSTEKSYTQIAENEKSVARNNLEGYELLNYYWNYFELQSTQRNQTCALYFPLLTALITGYVTAVHLQIIWAEYIALTAIILIAYAFGLMFSRTTKLRNNARKHIVEWENAHISFQKDRIFDGTEETNPTKFTYSTAFSIQFFAVGITSFIVMILTLSGILPF